MPRLLFPSPLFCVQNCIFLLFFLVLGSAFSSEKASPKDVFSPNLHHLPPGFLNLLFRMKAGCNDGGNRMKRSSGGCFGWKSGEDRSFSSFLQKKLEKKRNFPLFGEGEGGRGGRGGRRRFVGGNWKGNADKEGVSSMIELINKNLPSRGALEAEVVVAPSNIHCQRVLDELRPDIKVAVQDLSVKQGYGSFTGELTAEATKNFGIDWCILGHSERRRGFESQAGESNETVNRKLYNALNAGLRPIVCIGEDKQMREESRAQEYITSQLKAIYNQLSVKEDWMKIVLAYEPIWAIATGVAATPETTQETHKFIRNWIKDNVDESVAAELRIIYGGSVTASNAPNLVKCEDVDGFLVGKASLGEGFLSIISVCEQQKSQCVSDLLQQTKLNRKQLQYEMSTLTAEHAKRKETRL